MHAEYLGHSVNKEDPQGAAAIARVFGVHRKTVMHWKALGAPIVLVGKKYQCERDELWQWLKQNEERL